MDLQPLERQGQGWSGFVVGVQPQGNRGMSGQGQSSAFTLQPGMSA